MSLESRIVDNKPGICQLILAKTEDITEDSLDNFTATSVLALYFSPETANYSENPKRTAQGILYDAKFNLIVPKTREELINWINTNTLQYWVIIFQDMNGLIRKIGSLDLPLQLEAENRVPAEGRNEYQLSFRANLLATAEKCEYTFPIVIPETDDPDVIVSNILIFKTYSISLVARTAYNLVHNQNTSDFVAQFKANNLVQSIRIEVIDNNTIELYSEVSINGTIDIIFKKQIN